MSTTATRYQPKRPEPTPETIERFTIGSDDSTPDYPYARTLGELAQFFKVKSRTVSNWKENGAPVAHDHNGVYPILPVVFWRQDQDDVPAWLEVFTPQNQPLVENFGYFRNAIPSAAVHARKEFEQRLESLDLSPEQRAAISRDFIAATAKHFAHLCLSTEQTIEFLNEQ